MLNERTRQQQQQQQQCPTTGLTRMLSIQHRLLNIF